MCIAWNRRDCVPNAKSGLGFRLDNISLIPISTTCNKAFKLAAETVSADFFLIGWTKIGISDHSNSTVFRINLYMSQYCQCPLHGIVVSVSATLEMG